jgi:hypothetical protein
VQAVAKRLALADAAQVGSVTDTEAELHRP